MKKFQKVIVLQCLQQRQVAKMSGPNENENARLNLELTRQVAINNQLRETVATLMSYFRMPPLPPPNDLIPAQAPVRRPAQAPTSGSGQNGFRGRRRNGGKNRQSWYENNRARGRGRGQIDTAQQEGSSNQQAPGPDNA
ncbi:uncharacterized protein, partial [Chelonus insularis]|uniref:uncharacterized protein n=1 Tax=Chelonus insularis TaxID=460826 RepID=UPI0015886C44